MVVLPPAAPRPAPAPAPGRPAPSASPAATTPLAGVGIIVRVVTGVGGRVGDHGHRGILRVGDRGRGVLDLVYAHGCGISDRRGRASDWNRGDGSGQSGDGDNGELLEQHFLGGFEGSR